MQDELAGEELRSFTQWAMSLGVAINGVAPANFRGRRLGMVATRAIEEDEIMVSVPLAAMLTIDCIPPSFVDLFPKGMSLHAILAAFLIHGDASLLKKWDAWRKVWPPQQDLQDCMPILWPEDLRVSNSGFHGNSSSSQIVLPPSASGLWNSIHKEPSDTEYETRYQSLLAQQERRLIDAWENIVAVFPVTDWSEFSYHWLIVNTRSFFYVTPGKEAPEDWNDAVALVPFADYFNHQDNAPCEVMFDGQRYTFKATRRHEEGEEVYISYGSHPNDFLFTEYGFYLDHNGSDAIYMDDIVFRELTTEQKDELRLHQYYGNYQLTSAGACLRTEFAACIKYMNRRDWQNYVLGHSTQGLDPKKTANVIHGWVQVYLNESKTTIGILKKMLGKIRVPQGAADAGPDYSDDKKVAMALGRWIQIRRLCEDALGAISSSNLGGIR